MNENQTRIFYMQKEELHLQKEIKVENIARESCTRELAYMLSHELSQPLMVISAYVNGCIRRLEEKVYDKKKIINALKTVDHQINHTGHLIHRMKDYVRTVKYHYKKINIHHLIENTVALMVYEYHHFPIKIIYKFVENLPLIEIDETQIQLVIFSLLKNGIEEMIDAKTKQPTLIIETFKIDASTISVCVKDCGRGLSEQIQNQLFNFRFTTKPKNIGISLATCRSILEAHHGDIIVHSSSESGAALKFILPIKQE